MCTIIVFVFGIVALATGKFSLSAQKEVSGTPARVVGVLLLLPLPISFAVGFAYGFFSAMRHVQINENVIQFVELGIVAVFVIAALVVAATNAREKTGPPPRRRSWDRDDEDEDWRRRKRRDREEREQERRDRDERGREDDDEGPFDILETVPETQAVPPPLPPEAIQVGSEPIKVAPRSVAPPSVAPAPVAPTPVEPASLPESMIATCPSCGGLCRVPGNSVGKKARCPKCQTIFQVGPPPEAGIQEKRFS